MTSPMSMNKGTPLFIYLERIGHSSVVLMSTITHFGSSEITDDRLIFFTYN